MNGEWDEKEELEHAAMIEDEAISTIEAKLALAIRGLELIAKCGVHPHLSSVAIISEEFLREIKK